MSEWERWVGGWGVRDGWCMDGCMYGCIDGCEVYNT